MQNYRQVSNIDEIRVIAAFPSAENLGIIWQTTNTDRIVTPILGVDLQDDSLILIATENLRINQAFPIFIKLHHRDLVFRLRLGEYELMLNQLKCRYPTDARAIESRQDPRTQIPKKINVNITLRSMASSTILDTRVQLTDLSHGGLGGAVSRVNQDFFLRTSEFKIVKVGDKVVSENAVLTIRHLTEQGRGNKMRVGFSLSAPLSDIFFQLLKVEMKKAPSR